MSLIYNPSWLISGLGNPETKYCNTRHNVGYDVLNTINNNREIWSSGEHTCHCVNWEHNAILIKPITGMNNSGLAACDGLESISTDDTSLIIVIYDDVDFAPGDMKIKSGGGSAGHLGLQSIIDSVGSKFIRIRVGIGKPSSGDLLEKHVLGRFTELERIDINKAIINASRAVTSIVKDGIQSAQRKFNIKGK